MEAVCSSETYHSTRRYNPEDQHQQDGRNHEKYRNIDKRTTGEADHTKEQTRLNKTSLRFILPVVV
jgi:hypothetical protein